LRPGGQPASTGAAAASPAAAQGTAVTLPAAVTPAVPRRRRGRRGNKPRGRGKGLAAIDHAKLPSPRELLPDDGPPCPPQGGPAGPGDGTGSMTRWARGASPPPGG